mmetsp:Transcript_5195/g.7536  ORF Transcript_5195/g.7536 Transcript_5195/m.7536 type:complete len:1694 (+) Transcript_5195:72-5153(+)
MPSLERVIIEIDVEEEEGMEAQLQEQEHNIGLEGKMEINEITQSQGPTEDLNHPSSIEEIKSVTASTCQSVRKAYVSPSKTDITDLTHTSTMTSSDSINGNDNKQTCSPSRPVVTLQSFFPKMPALSKTANKKCLPKDSKNVDLLQANGANTKAAMTLSSKPSTQTTPTKKSQLTQQSKNQAISTHSTHSTQSTHSTHSTSSLKSARFNRERHIGHDELLAIVLGPRYDKDYKHNQTYNMEESSKGSENENDKEREYRLKAANTLLPDLVSLDPLQVKSMVDRKAKARATTAASKTAIKNLSTNQQPITSSNSKNNACNEHKNKSHSKSSCKSKSNQMNFKHSSEPIKKHQAEIITPEHGVQSEQMNNNSKSYDKGQEDKQIVKNMPDNHHNVNIHNRPKLKPKQHTAQNNTQQQSTMLEKKKKSVPSTCPQKPVSCVQEVSAHSTPNKSQQKPATIVNPHDCSNEKLSNTTHCKLPSIIESKTKENPIPTNNQNNHSNPSTPPHKSETLQTNNGSPTSHGLEKFLAGFDKLSKRKIDLSSSKEHVVHIEKADNSLKLQPETKSTKSSTPDSNIHVLQPRKRSKNDKASFNTKKMKTSSLKTCIPASTSSSKTPEEKILTNTLTTNTVVSSISKQLKRKQSAVGTTLAIEKSLQVDGNAVKVINSKNENINEKSNIKSLGIPTVKLEDQMGKARKLDLKKDKKVGSCKNNRLSKERKSTEASNCLLPKISTKVANKENTKNHDSSLMKDKISPNINIPKTTKSDPNSIKTKIEQTNESKEVIPYCALSEAEKALVLKHGILRKKYLEKIHHLVNSVENGQIQEEEFQNNKDTFVFYEPSLSQKSVDESDFKDEWLPELCTLVQGSVLPLNDLARKARTIIMNGKESEEKIISLDAIAMKIKLIASRKQYFQPISHSSLKERNMDIFNDADLSRFWRWELISLDLLTGKDIASAKKAIRVRKRLQNRHRAIRRLLLALDEADFCITKVDVDKSHREKSIAKVSLEEEKVLKFEREAEKANLLEAVKVQKEKEKQQKQLQKEKEKHDAEENRRQEKIKREEEKEKKRKDALDSKKKKEEEEVRERERQAKKQKARLMSFFTAPPSPMKVCKSSSKNPLVKPGIFCSPQQNNLLSKAGVILTEDKSEVNNSTLSDRFWSSIDSVDTVDYSHNNKQNISARAKSSRRRRTCVKDVKVFVTKVSENPFDPQPYDEEKIVKIRNKFKFLKFHEDYRPPYYGTWSKPLSSVVNGRRPLGKDLSHLDYDVDSEAEWEEGDDEEGEDCSECGNDDDDIDDEEGDNRVYNYDDGWLAQDDDYGLNEDEDDDEAKEMRRREVEVSKNKVITDKNSTFKPSEPCVIAPMDGGIAPMNGLGDCPELLPELLHGFEKSEAIKHLENHFAQVLHGEGNICLSVFPPDEEVEETCDADAGVVNLKSNTSTEMSDKDMITFAKFIHNSTYSSKERIVEEVREKHSNITSSRSQAMRKLDVIASKRRLKNGGGVIWEVKNEVLESLGLEELINPPEDKIKEEPSPKAMDKNHAIKGKDKDMSDQDFKTFIKFVHNSTSNSKEKIVEEFRCKHSKIISSRSQAIRKLDLIANKRRLKDAKGVVWEVKNDVLHSNGLAELINTPDALLAHREGPSIQSPTKTTDCAKIAPKSVTPNALEETASPSRNKKRKLPLISNASANILASFLKRKKVA